MDDDGMSEVFDIIKDIKKSAGVLMLKLGESSIRSESRFRRGRLYSQTGRREVVAPQTVMLSDILRQARVNPEQFCKNENSVIGKLFEVKGEDYLLPAISWVRQSLALNECKNPVLKNIFSNKKLAKHVIPRILAYPDGRRYVPSGAY